MLGLVAAVFFAGYTLVYAAVADGGRFAATPWEALRKDPYTGGAAKGQSAPAHPSTFDQIVSGIGFLTNPIGSLLAP